MSKKFVSKENLSTFWGKVKALVSANVTTAGTGLSKSGTTLNHSNSVTAGTIGTSSATSGSTLAVPYATYDAQGHIKTKGTHTHTVTGFAASSHTHAASDITDANKLKVYRQNQTSGYNSDYPVLVSRTPVSGIGTSGVDGSSSVVDGIMVESSGRTLTYNPHAKRLTVASVFSNTSTAEAMFIVSDTGNPLTIQTSDGSAILKVYYVRGEYGIQYSEDHTVYGTITMKELIDVVVAHRN